MGKQSHYRKDKDKFERRKQKKGDDLNQQREVTINFCARGQNKILSNWGLGGGEGGRRGGHYLQKRKITIKKNLQQKGR